MLAIGLKMVSVMLFLATWALIKASSDMPAGELVFFRSLFALLTLMVLARWRGDLSDAFHTKRPMAHLGRGIVGCLGMGFGFAALGLLPLPEAVAINYATPLLVVLFSAIFLKEQVGIFRWSAVLVGFSGVAIIVWPRLTAFQSGDIEGVALWGAALMLTSACFVAIVSLLVRRLVVTEKSITVVLYFSAVATLVGLCTLPFGWVMPSWQHLGFLICAGISGGLAQNFLTESYRHADLSVVAPFTYSSLVFSIIIGYLAFGDVPTLEMIIGGSILVVAGIFMIYRERALGLEREKARAAAPPDS